MTTEKLDQAINSIRPELIEEASEDASLPRRNLSMILKISAAAAALVLCVAGSIYALPLITGKTPDPSGEITGSESIHAGGFIEKKGIQTGNGIIFLTTVREANDGMPAIRISEQEAAELTELLSGLEASEETVQTEPQDGYLLCLEEGDTLTLLANGDILVGKQLFIDPSGRSAALYQKAQEILSRYYRK